MEKDCLFCKIAGGEIPSRKVYEDEMSLAFLDINPVNPGHTLIIPKKHFENIYDLNEEIAAHLMKVAKKISIALKKTGVDGINITMNNEKDAGQVIFHSHIHIMPRIKGDNLPMWPGKKLKDEELDEMAKKISSGLART